MDKLGFVDKNGSIDIYIGSRLLLTYHYDNANLKSYFHPVHLPDGQTPVTLESPHDHPWHHGLFFTWKYINGINYWEDNLPEDQRGRMTTVGTISARSDGRVCEIGQQLSWHEMNGAEVIDENRKISIERLENENGYLIRFSLRFKAKTKKLLLDRTNPDEFDWGGYAGLSYRPVRSMSVPRILNSENAAEVAAAHGRRARWCDYSGKLDGGADKKGGITLLDHPDNERHPSPFYVFDRGELQFLQAAFLFDSPYVMRPGQILHLRYGAYVHEGYPERDQIERVYER